MAADSASLPPPPVPTGAEPDDAFGPSSWQAAVPSLPERFNLADWFLFVRVTEGRGDWVALRFGHRVYTYAEVADRAQRVAAMLAGQPGKAGDDALVGLSTYGILKGLSADKCAELLQLLVEQRLCEITTGRYPLLRISAEGWEVMQGRKGAGFRPPPHLVPGALPARRARLLREGQRSLAERGAPERGAPERSHPDSSAPARGAPRASAPATESLAEDAEALALLRAYRLKLAHERGKPAFVIFSDRTLHALAAARPRNEAEFMALPGLGAGKWADFGPDVVRLLAD